MSDQQKKQKKAKRNALALNIVDKVGHYARKIGPGLALAAVTIIAALAQNKSLKKCMFNDIILFTEGMCKGD